MEVSDRGNISDERRSGIKALIERLRTMVDPQLVIPDALAGEAAAALEEMEKTITEMQIQHSRGHYTPLHEADRRRLKAELAEATAKVEAMEKENAQNKLLFSDVVYRNERLQTELTEAKKQSSRVHIYRRLFVFANGEKNRIKKYLKVVSNRLVDITRNEKIISEGIDRIKAELVEERRKREEAEESKIYDEATRALAWGWKAKFEAAREVAAMCLGMYRASCGVKPGDVSSDADAEIAAKLKEKETPLEEDRHLYG